MDTRVRAFFTVSFLHSKVLRCFELGHIHCSIIGAVTYIKKCILPCNICLVMNSLSDYN